VTHDAGNLLKVSAFLKYGVEFMWFTQMHDVLAHLSRVSDYIPAILVTIGVAVLIGCAVGCVCTPCEENDDIFHPEVY
jgi:predicted MFS family arabinose efflux permease